MQKQDFLDCHNKKTRVTYDAIKQKHSSKKCHIAKNGVSKVVIIEKLDVHMMPYSENRSSIVCHNANS